MKLWQKALLIGIIPLLIVSLVLSSIAISNSNNESSPGATLNVGDLKINGTLNGDPNADKFLMWDDDPGDLIWQSSTSKPSGSIFLSAQGGWPRTTNGCAPATKTESSTNKINYYTLDFDTSSDEYCQWDFAMPSDWDAGTITAQIYWTFSTGSASETVDFTIKAGSIGNDDAIDTALGTAQTCTDTATTAGDVHVTAASSAITVAGAGASEWIVVECMRDVSEDNLAGDAKLIGIMITFTRA